MSLALTKALTATVIIVAVDDDSDNDSIWYFYHHIDSCAGGKVSESCISIFQKTIAILRHKKNINQQ